MLLDKYFTAFKNVWQVELFYRTNNLIRFFIAFISLIVVYFLWNNIYAGKAEILGFTKEQMVTYYMLAIFLMSAIYPGLGVSDDIRDGRLSMCLTRPYSYFWQVYFEEIARSCCRLLFGLPILLILFVVLRNNVYIVTNIQSYFYLFVTVFFAFNILFLIDMIISLLEFWIIHSDSLFYVFDGITAFFSGAVLPLFLFPMYLQRVADFLPFKYTVYFIINSFFGRIETKEILYGILIQISWIIILSIIVKLVWKAGLKKYEAFGG